MLASPAAAREPAWQVDIPAGPLSSAIDRFSAITGISVGFQGDMPRIATPRVTGRMTSDKILQKLLDGTGLYAVRVGPALYRIEYAPRARRAPLPSPPPPPPSPPPILVAPPPIDIIVTAQKRLQSLSDVPLSVAVLSFQPLPRSRTPSTRDISLDLEGLATTNMGPGRNRQFIRGIADSPFNGLSQSTVAIQVDDARVTFNAPDPDLRLIDVERVEILKGPQGPLYGSGALGGIYHIVTRKPDLDSTFGSVRLSGEALQDGQPGTGAEAILNLPLIDGTLAVRGAIYRFMNGGWINNEGGQRDSNSTETAGMRMGVRWRPADHWTVDAGFIFQNIHSRDSQYMLASGHKLIRPHAIAEPNENDFELWHGTIKGEIGALELTSATSYVDHDFDTILDASMMAAAFGLTGPVRFDERRRYSVLNQEVRLTPTGSNHWLVGLSYLQATTRGGGQVTDDSNVAQTVETYDRRVIEYAAFGEGRVQIADRLNATLGARLFHSVTQDGTGTHPIISPVRISKTILSPSASLSLDLGEQGLLFLRYARSMRPGGLAPANMAASRQFDADGLSSLDLGLRRSSQDGRFSLTASLYYTRWNAIQSDYLLSNGLISTHNAGRGEIVGSEISTQWIIGKGFTLSAGGSAQSARLTHTATGVELDDRRLPVAPALAGRIALTKHFRLSDDWQGQAAIQANYIGKARLSLDDDLDREMGNYTVASANAELSRDAWTLGVRLDNLLNVRGDSFAFGNPFSIRAAPQYTPLRPRTLTLSVARSW
ncbi:TonB-dependent receptor [Sphingobium sp. BYY-5]|uniref:TonB-dependent receptor n=1 Tax=Sphingobium sp. BYY-5 TaxID=2926400 RepID=UPI001FA706AE|nr:TonB-dependent receptor [Sphingobium sp. BYY-5]MCI4588851.1 TonB-dependent receptor [Sphingobium sp. BYY-5]